MTEHPEVLIVGGGLAGLCCARRLAQANVRSLVLESSDAIGGRVRTDEVDGFLLDRGFQVLLTAYPEARATLDYPALELRSFHPGALVHWRGRLHRIADPLRAPADAIVSLFSPLGSLADKLRVGKLWLDVRRESPEALLHRPETTTLARLRAAGFSDSLIERFLRPFFAGVFLERELVTSSRFFDFVFRMFAGGSIAIPAGGMGSIPTQIAAGLPAGTLRTGTRVSHVTPGSVTLESGESLDAAAVVVATDGDTAARLVPAIQPPIAWNGCTTLYFAAGAPPVRLPILILDGEGTGPVNNVCVVSEVAPGTAPPSMALISATVVGIPDSEDPELESAVRAQLAGWFGTEVGTWRLLRIYRLPNALPAEPPGVLDPPRRPVRVEAGLYVCGDHRDDASINGAMVSGRRTAKLVLEGLGR